VASLHDSGAAGIGRPEPRRLTCVECGKTARGDATGWRSYVTVDDQVATYCPACAERVFGEDGSA
jgi:dissimilatory sulfite reductase (desulfoviridin) alpha/beta subunit